MLITGLKSWYSLKWGMLSPAEAVAAAKAAGATTVAFADHGEMAGYGEFMEACKAKHINVIPGIEAGFEFEGRVFPFEFYACGKEGLPDFLSFVSKMKPRGSDPLPIVDPSSITQSIVMLSPGSTGAFTDFIFRKDAMGLRRMFSHIRTTGARVAFGVDPETMEPAYHFLLAGQHSMLPYRAAVYPEQNEFTFRDICRYCFGSEPPDNYAYERPVIRTVEDWAKISQSKQNLSFEEKNMAIFAERFAIPHEQIELPQFSPVIPYKGMDEKTAMEELRRICTGTIENLFASAGVARQYVDKALRARRLEEYEARMEAELSMISEAGLSTRLLALRDAVLVSRESGGSPSVQARGSATNSLVCYLSGLTTVNSLFFELPSERFLSNNRVSPPDIDIDVSAAKTPAFRASLMAGVPGSARLRQFTNSTIMAMLPAIMATNGIKDGKARRIATKIDTLLGRTNPADRKRSFADLVAAYPSFQKEFFTLGDRATMETLATALTQAGSRPIQSTIHVGIALADRPIAEGLPVIALNCDGDVCPAVALPHNQLEKYGILKADVLTNHHFDFLATLDAVLLESGCKPIAHGIPQRSSHYEAIVQKGRVAGIFQFANQEDLLRRLHPEDFDELANANALIRLSGEAGKESPVARYIAAGSQPQASPILASLPEAVRLEYARITAKTRGVVIYQEQLTRGLHAVSGMPLIECERIRKSMAKKSDALAGQQAKAITEIQKHCQISSEAATNVFSTILKEGKYLFNQGHAYAYAMIAYAEIAAKHDQTAEFVTARVRAYRNGAMDESRTKFRDTLSRLAYESTRLGVAIEAPDFSRSLLTAPTGYRVKREGSDRVTRSHILLGVDSFPSVTDADVVKLVQVQKQLREGETLTPAIALAGGVSKDALVQCISSGAFTYTQKTPKELLESIGAFSPLDPIPNSKTACYQQFGFYPSSMHPGLALKPQGTACPIPVGSLRNSSAFTHGQTVTVTGFLKGEPTFSSKPECFLVSIELTSGIGDTPIRARRRFHLNERDEAMRLKADISSCVVNHAENPVMLELRKQEVHGFTYWDIVSPTVKVAPLDVVVPMLDLVDQEARKMIPAPVSQTAGKGVAG